MFRNLWRAVLRWVAPLLFIAFPLVPAAYAQKDAAPAKTERMPPAPQYALAIISALVVLLIVCMPSRKV